MRRMLIATAAVWLSIFSLDAYAQQELPPGGSGTAPPSAQPQVAPPPSPAGSPATPPAPQYVPQYMMMPPDSHHMHHPMLADSSMYRSPGLSVVLSLTPLPIDFGNFYAENLGWGIAYTAIEVSLAMPMMWFVGGHMDHGSDNHSWSGGERMGMMGMAAGYVAVKLIAGLHAGNAARELNQRSAPGWSALVMPAPGGALASWHLRF